MSILPLVAVLTSTYEFLLLTAILVLAELLAGVWFLRHDRPSAPPPSHLDWSAGLLPSRPYTSRA